MVAAEAEDGKARRFDADEKLIIADRASWRMCCGVAAALPDSPVPRGGVL